MVAREELHRLVDLLPEEDWSEAQEVLQGLLDADDELLTETDWEAIAEGEAAIARGDCSDFEDVKRRLGV